MRWLLALAMSVGMLLAQTVSQPVRPVTAIERWSSADATHVAAQASGGFAYRTGRLPDPERAYFDILNARLNVGSRSGYVENIGERLVTRVRAAELPAGIIRGVLYLAEATGVPASPLAGPDRLVIELRSRGALASATAASSASTAVSQAALGETPPRTEAPTALAASRATVESAGHGPAMRAADPHPGPTLDGSPGPLDAGKLAIRAEGNPAIHAVDVKAWRLPARAPALVEAATGPRELTLTIGRGAVIDCPDGVELVSTSNPEAVDVVTAGEKVVLFQAKALGQATLAIWSKTGGRLLYEVTVEPNIEPLRRLLKETFPGEDIDLRASRDSMALVGRVSSQAVADKALALVAASYKGAVGNLRVAPAAAERQILLKVRFAELSHTASAQFGINLLSTGAGGTPGAISTGQFASGGLNQITGGSAPTATTFTLSQMLNIFAFRPSANLAALIEDLQSRGLLQILAEPDLVATTGKEASFLAGGEFPVPIAQGGSASGAISIQYKEYGIKLTFLPQLTANHTVRLHVKPEVSSIDPANGVTLGGFRVPALSTRRFETDIELADGQSFVIAGLLDQQVTDEWSKLPGIDSIPVIGALFRSRARTKSRDELVVVVTPEAVAPLDGPAPLPEMPSPFLGPPKAGEAR